MSGQYMDQASCREIIRRLDKTEAMLEVLRETDTKFTETLSKLNTTLALVNQTQINQLKREDDAKAFQSKMILFIVASFIAAGVTWVVRGGLI